jgi:hypothetical protein
MKKQFIIFTADHSGLAIAIRLKYEGYKVKLAMIKPWEKTGKIVAARDAKQSKEWAKRMKYLDQNGTGLVDKVWASDVVKQAHKGDGVYYIFDQIYGSQFSEALRKKGCLVLGGSKVGYELEKDRDATLRVLGKSGLDIPEQQEFGKGSSKKAIEFLQKNADKLYVLKSDNPAVVTQVASDSNDELIQKLTAEAKLIDAEPFLLQEKVAGEEIAIETWYYEGKPVLCCLNLEDKLKYNPMCEVQTGCAFSIDAILPPDSPLRMATNAKLDAYAAKNIGTGLLDISVIYDHSLDKYWALEVCGSRFGYNAIFSTFALLKIDVGQFLAGYMDGKLDPEKAFATDQVATSLRLFNDSETPDQMIDFPAEMMPDVWLWDCYMKSGELMTTGDDAIAIITATGENPEGSFAELRKKFFQFHCATKYARDDIDEEDDPRLPLTRYHKLRQYKLI